MVPLWIRSSLKRYTRERSFPAETSRCLIIPLSVQHLGWEKPDWNEHLGRAYLYWTPYKWLAFRAEYGMRNSSIR